MDDEESSDWFGYVPDGVPDDRCGYTTEYEDFGLPGNITCWRETWDGHGQCIWHADAEGKPAEEVADARRDGPERIDGAVLRGVEWIETVDFSGCSLLKLDFTNANLHRTIFRRANLRKANFSHADLQEIDFSHSNLQKTNFSHADLRDADFNDVYLYQTNFSHAVLHQPNINPADIFLVNFSHAIFLGGDLSEADLSEADFSEAGLTGTDLTAADLTDANFTRANLEGADLTNACLWESILTDAYLSGANLTNAYLWEANLTNAYLDDAILTDANLEDVSLESADLDGTDLTDAKLHNCRLQDIYISEETEFGGCCAYEREVREAIESGEPLEDQVERLEKAISTYRTYQRLHRENSLPGDIPHYFYREKEMRRLKALAEGDRRDWATRALQKWVMGYGEKPWRVVITSVLTIFGFGVLYSLFGGIYTTSEGGDPLAYDLLPTIPLSTPEPLEILLGNLYFSAVTFSTLGYGDVEPASGAVQFLASAQSIIGAGLMAPLVAVLARRITR